METSTVLNIGLWVAQIILAATFIWAGIMKLFKPSALSFPWVKDNPRLVTTTGIFNLLGGVGIIFPALLNIQPQVTIYAAWGITLLMLSAIVFHISRKEASQIGFNIFVILLALFIVWKR